MIPFDEGFQETLGWLAEGQRGKQPMPPTTLFPTQVDDWWLGSQAAFDAMAKEDADFDIFMEKYANKICAAVGLIVALIATATTLCGHPIIGTLLIGIAIYIISLIGKLNVSID
jgi:hypothetical protein